MSVYAGVWNGVVSATVVISLVGGAQQPGWFAMFVCSGLIGLLGGLFHYTWVDDVRLPSSDVARSAVLTGLVALVVVGLPSIVGAWTLVVVAALVLSSPELIGLLGQRIRRKRPLPSTRRLRHYADAELGYRWCASGAQLRHPGTTPERRLALVEERSRLLDELERRDPHKFQDRLAQAGWDVSER